jgi:hypothetical protein
MTMKNSNDTIGNRTRDLPSCSEIRSILKAKVYENRFMLFYTPPCNIIKFFHNINEAAPILRRHAPLIDFDYIWHIS